MMQQQKLIFQTCEYMLSTNFVSIGKETLKKKRKENQAPQKKKLFM